jgi:hypothetical protein
MKNPNSSEAEKDWKYLCSIKNELLENCSRKGNDQIRKILEDDSLSENEKRYQIYKSVKDHDKLMEVCFNNWTRSQIFNKALLLKRNQILENRFYENLSEEKRKGIEAILEIYPSRD